MSWRLVEMLDPLPEPTLPAPASLKYSGKSMEEIKAEVRAALSPQVRTLAQMPEEERARLVAELEKRENMPQKMDPLIQRAREYQRAAKAASRRGK